MLNVINGCSLLCSAFVLSVSLFLLAPNGMWLALAGLAMGTIGVMMAFRNLYLGK